ncbi:dTMP kinase, partial [bacterium]|nr:dTMP kinase [bacterium]
MHKNGFFVTFEGVDGSGKSLQAKLLTQRLENEGYPVLLIRDPGTTAISEEIRNIVLNTRNTAL